MLDYTKVKRKRISEKRARMIEIDRYRQEQLNKQRYAPQEEAPDIETPFTLRELGSDSVASIKIPENWADLNWPKLRDLAQKIAGKRELGSRAEARMLVAAYAKGQQ